MVCSEIFNKNMEAFRKNDFYQAIIGKEYVNQLIELWENGDYQPRLDDAADGSVIACKADGSKYYNSRYAPEYAASVWASQFLENTGSDYTFYLLGFANGMYARELVKGTNITNKIFIYEPDMEMYLNVLNEIDITDLIACNYLFLLVKGINDQYLMDFLSVGVSYNSYKKVMECILPNYYEFKEDLDAIDKILQYQVEYQQLAKNTNLVLAEVCRKNELMNLPDVIRQHSVNQLIKQFITKDLSQIPAILVSAGPSLDKNVRELKAAEGHAFIIVVDTAMKAVLRNDITPNLIICIDPKKALVFFDNERFLNIPIVVEKDIPPQIIQQHKGSRFYTGRKYDITDYMAEKYEKGNYLHLETGGSVANSAFTLIRKLGFKNIILVGQDLAFTDGKWHTKDAYDDEVRNRKDAEESIGACEVEGIYGGMVRTESRMRSYLKWFENMIAKYSELHVVDGTEGGARIHGSEILTLKEAIARYGVEEVVDFKELIESIEDLYSPVEQSEIREYLLSINKHLEEYQKKSHHEIDVYKKLKKALKHNNGLESKSLMNQIKEINRSKKVDPLESMLHKYAIVSEYETHDKVIGLDLEIDDSLKIIDDAIGLLEAYLDAAEEMKLETHLLTDQLEIQ